MTPLDKYSTLAERYSQMIQDDPLRESFFKNIFSEHEVKNVLDCACGTGNDLILLHSMGCQVVGSDVSDSMLRVARRTVGKCKPGIELKKADFQNLAKVHRRQFDAVVCLGNAINEEGVDPVKALRSMRQVLSPNGIIIFDQGQTDAIMKNPPAYVPVVNNSCLSRMFTIKYDKDVMTVDISDFVHDEREGQFDFKQSQIKIQIRLKADWEALLGEVGLKADYYGSWAGEKYDKRSSRRLIVVAAPR